MIEFPFGNSSVSVTATQGPSLVKLDRDTSCIHWSNDRIIPIQIEGASEDDAIYGGDGSRLGIDRHVEHEALETIRCLGKGEERLNRGVGGLGLKTVGLNRKTNTPVKPWQATAGLDAEMFRKSLHVASGRRSLRLVDAKIGVTHIVVEVHGGRAEQESAKGIAIDVRGASGYGARCTCGIRVT